MIQIGSLSTACNCKCSRDGYSLYVGKQSHVLSYYNCKLIVAL